MPSTVVAGSDLYVVRPTASLTVGAAQGVLANDTDVGGGGLSVVSYTQPKYGSVSVAPDGSFVFTGPTSQDLSAIGGPAIHSLADVTPNGLTDGLYANTFTYTVKDAGGNTSTGTVNVGIHSAPPVTVGGPVIGDYRINALSSGVDFNFYYTTLGSTVSAGGTDGILAHVASPLGLPLHVVGVNPGFQGSWGADGSFSTTVSQNAVFYISDGFETSAANVAIGVDNYTGPDIPEAHNPDYHGETTIVVLHPTQSITVPVEPPTYTTPFDYINPDPNATITRITRTAAPGFENIAYNAPQLVATNFHPTDLTVTASGSSASITASSHFDFSYLTAQVSYVTNKYTYTEITSDKSVLLGYYGETDVTDGTQYTELPGVLIYAEDPSPSATNDSYAVASGKPTAVTAAAGLLANDRDVDGYALTVSTYNQPSHGAVVVNPDGSFTYTPVAGYVGTDSFNYVVSDPYGQTSFPIGVNTSGVPDSPSTRPAQVTLNVAAGGFVTITGTQGGQSASAGTPLNPFAQAAVADSVGGADTVTVTFNGAAGTLSGGGFAGANGVYTVVASSAGQATADLRAAVFTPAAVAAGAASTTTTFTVGVVDGDNAATDSATTVTVGPDTTKPTITGTTSGRTTTDKTSANPFPQVALGGSANSETLKITYAAADGTLSGGGFSGAPGGYTATFASPAAAQAALRALVFTPTANEATPGQSVTTVFTLAATIAGVTTVDTTTSLTTTSVNDAPGLGGAVAAQAATAGVGQAPFTTVTVTDPDVGQTETVTVTFAGANGVLSGGGFAGTDGVYSVQAASAAAAQADLRAAVFTPTNGLNATTLFTVSVSDGLAAATDATTTVIAAAASGGGGGSGGDGGGAGGAGAPGGGSSLPGASPPSVSTGFATIQAPNLFRVAPGDADALSPDSPLYAQMQAQKAISAQLDGGRITQAQAEAQLLHLADGTTAVAVADYAFFTGYTPTAAGLNYLVHSQADATDLNDPYYAKFSTENRFINFAVNLATGAGVGAAAFQASYGGLSLPDALAKAYVAVFGAVADAAKVSAILDGLVPDGLGGQETRAQYFAQLGGDGPNGQGTKAAAVGFLLSQAVHDGSGVYGAATEHYLAAVAHGTAPASGSELALTYGPAVNLVGAPVVADPTVTG